MVEHTYRFWAWLLARWAVISGVLIALLHVDIGFAFVAGGGILYGWDKTVR